VPMRAVEQQVHNCIDHRFAPVHPHCGRAPHDPESRLTL
jgi:hypothetical protein